MLAQLGVQQGSRPLAERTAVAKLGHNVQIVGIVTKLLYLVMRRSVSGVADK